MMFNVGRLGAAVQSSLGAAGKVLPPTRAATAAANVTAANSRQAAATAARVTAARTGTASGARAAASPRRTGMFSRARSFDNPVVNRLAGRPNSFRRNTSVGLGIGMGGVLGANAVVAPRPPSSGTNGLRGRSSGGMGAF